MAEDFNPDAFIAENSQPVANTSPNDVPLSPDISIDGFNPDEFIAQSNEEKYGSVGQQIKAGLEGAAEGVLGPLAPLIETKVLGVKEEDIRGRREENPIARGVGVATGLGAGLLTGAGIAGQTAKQAAKYTLPGAMTAAGNAATKAVGLGELAKEATIGMRIGSEAVRQAAEMAVLQGSDEVAKVVLHDPNVGAESAIANVGLAAALGGGGGALIGSVSPIWKATMGPKVEEFLTRTVPGQLDLSPNVKDAFSTLGMEPGVIAKAAMSGDDKALRTVQELIRAQNPKVLEELATYPKLIRENLSQRVGMNVDDAIKFSAKDAGEAIEKQLKKDIDAKYGPRHAEMQKRKLDAEGIDTGLQDRYDFSGQMMERGLKDVTGPDSPYYKLYEEYAERVMNTKTIGKLDLLKTEIFTRARGARDGNEAFALRNIGRMVDDFQESQINKFTAREGIDTLGKALNDERTLFNNNYREFISEMEELMEFIGVGNWRGHGKLMDKLDSIKAEDIVKRFATKGDAEGAMALKTKFPEVAELVRQYELKKFLSNYVKEEVGEVVLNSKTLAESIAKLRKDFPEQVEYLFPNGAAEAIDAGKVIHDAITHINRMKDSGTPGGMAKVFKHGLGTVMGALGWILGSNPISAALIGELAQRLAVNAPQEIKYAMLKYLTSDKGISSGGFKAMVDFAGKVAKEQAKINKGVESVFKTSGVQVVASNQPTQQDRDKLQKRLDKIQKNPEIMVADEDDLSHYMPDQRTAIAAKATNAAQYLESIRPKGFKPGPLDPEIPPSKAEMARYNRALDIAINPLTVLQNVKDGTIQTTDIQDLRNMYPALYDQYSRKLMDQVTNMQASEEIIPYKTKIGISLFLGTPLDASMKPESIQSAQPKPAGAPPQAPNTAPIKPKKSTAPLTKAPGQHMLPGQAREANKND